MLVCCSDLRWPRTLLQFTARYNEPQHMHLKAVHFTAALVHLYFKAEGPSQTGHKHKQADACRDRNVRHTCCNFDFRSNKLTFTILSYSPSGVCMSAAHSEPWFASSGTHCSYADIPSRRRHNYTHQTLEDTPVQLCLSGPLCSPA